jgi:hypothetical protein
MSATTGRRRRGGGGGATRPAARRRRIDDRDLDGGAARRASRSVTVIRPAPPSRLDGPLDEDRVLAVDLLELDPDDLLARRRHVLADVVRPDRQLAMAAVDEDREADRLRPPEVDERVHRRPDRPARVEDVVDEDDRRAVQVEREVVPLTTAAGRRATGRRGRR